MSDIEPPTNNDLVAAYRAGDTDAFAAIYDRHASVVFSYYLARGRSRAEAADATNEVFVEASQRLDVQESPDHLRPWLLGIAAELAGEPTDGETEEPADIVAAPPALRPRVLDKVDREVVSTLTMGGLDPEWTKVGVFALVTLVVGLIGLVVSAQFQPLPSLPTNPDPPTALVASTTTSSTPAPSTSTTGEEASSSTTGVAPEDAAISVSTENVDFGEDEETAQIELANSGGQPGEWEMTSSSEAIVASPDRGELEPGASVTIDLTLDRENLAEGDLEETLTVVWTDGQAEIAVSGSHEDNPVIHNPQASPPSIQVSGNPECTNTETTVSARIRDTSALESVVVRWSPDGGAPRETEMTSVGDDMFEARIGPFTVSHNAEARIVAFDERGNAGGASTQIAVVECP